MTVKHTLVSLDMRVFALCSLMELHRSQETGTRSEAVRSLRYRKGCHHLRYGADARLVQHRSGNDFDNYGFGRILNTTANSLAA